MSAIAKDMVPSSSNYDTLIKKYTINLTKEKLQPVLCTTV